MPPFPHAHVVCTCISIVIPVGEVLNSWNGEMNGATVGSLQVILKSFTCNQVYFPGFAMFGIFLIEAL